MFKKRKALLMNEYENLKFGIFDVAMGGMWVFFNLYMSLIVLWMANENNDNIILSLFTAVFSIDKIAVRDI